ncbi:MAG: DnrO protein [Thermomonas sp.]|uniref:DnrO protein n=1 Tax=Thermomonas sp. TaxID=1971895 RepID=UPI002605983F|nr:DnrO protein [Thermomonas sp.]MCC7095645.1 DnrO protein [Thermomonas sp.]
MRLQTVIPMCVLGTLLVSAPACAQSTSHADHAAHATHAVHSGAQAAPTQRWATDAPLRAGMREIRAATGILGHIHAGRLNTRLRPVAVARIDAAIKNMIANCKLQPQADAALHGLLAKFIAGADAARQGRLSPGDLAAMQQALARYPQLFNDPGWAAGR